MNGEDQEDKGGACGYVTNENDTDCWDHHDDRGLYFVRTLDVVGQMELIVAATVNVFCGIVKKLTGHKHRKDASKQDNWTRKRQKVCWSDKREQKFIR